VLTYYSCHRAWHRYFPIPPAKVTYLYFEALLGESNDFLHILVLDWDILALHLTFGLAVPLAVQACDMNPADLAKISQALDSGAGEPTSVTQAELLTTSESEGSISSSRGISPSASTLTPAGHKLKRSRKQDSTDPASVEGTVSKRTLQNRKAQREFRERKASYVKSLEERVRQYETGTMQGNVELQKVSRRLREENLQLREQLKTVTQRLRELEAANPQLSVSGMHVAAPMMHVGRPGPSGMSRGRGEVHHTQTAQTQPPFFNHPPNFTNEAPYDVMSAFTPASVQANAQNYPQYFSQVHPLCTLMTVATQLQQSIRNRWTSGLQPRTIV
jgi:hypothetical protein